MEMDSVEICNKVIKNGGDRKYISILAQLNACRVSEIENVLMSNDFNLVNGSWKKQSTIIENVSKVIIPKEVKLKMENIKENVEDVTEVKPDNNIVSSVGMLESVMEKDLSLDEKVAKYYETHNVSYKKVAQIFNVSSWFVSQAVKKVNKGTKNYKGSKKLSVSQQQMFGSEMDVVQLPAEFIQDLDTKVKESLYTLVVSKIEFYTKLVSELEKTKYLLEVYL